MNVLIVGLGSIAQKHINVLNQIGKFTIYALRSSPNSNKVEGVTNIYSLNEIKDVHIDFAIISNYTSEHKNTIISLTTLKCPLFIEKPIYHKLDIEDVFLDIKKENILTYVACNLRFLDCLLFVKNEIETNNKRINEVNSYCGSYLPNWRKIDFRKSYNAIPSLGGGVHIDLIHEIDYLYWLFNYPLKIHSVLKNSSSLGIEAFDYANYCLDYDLFCANVILNYYRKDYKRTLEILFEDVSWLIDLEKNTVSANNKIIFSSDQKIIDTYLPQMEYFIKLIKEDKKESFNSIFDAYNVLKISLNDIKE